MSAYFLPSSFIYLFGLFNLLGINHLYFRSQLIFGLIGVFVFLIVKKAGLHFFRANAYPLYWIFLAILIVTFIIGMEVKGSRRWIDLYFFSFQGSEFYKIFFAIFIADFYIKHKRSLKEFSVFVKALIYFLIPTLIIFKQPDLGNAIIFATIFFSITFFSGIPKRSILKLSMLTVFILPLGWMLLKEYQKARILSFLNPHLDQSGNAYNMIQAIITVGSGKFIGKGLGRGTQSELLFLPENHTDFAYSSLVEQFGFVGGFTVIVLYAILAIILLKKIFRYYGEKSEDSQFKFLFTIGFFSYFIVQVFVNIGMNLGIMPITGITLPLISYGGSSLVTWMIAMALLP